MRDRITHHASRAGARPEFLPDPVIGRAVALTGARGDSTADIGTRLREARRGLRVALAYHGAENVTNAFSYWLDDFAWDKASALFHAKGWRGKYMVGFYEGPEHILAAETAMYGTTSATRTGAALHHRPQPLIDVNVDGSKAKVRARLINVPHRWSAIAIDEPYIASDGWKRGWARPRVRSGGPDPVAGSQTDVVPLPQPGQRSRAAELLR